MAQIVAAVRQPKVQEDLSAVVARASVAHLPAGARQSQAQMH